MPDHLNLQSAAVSQNEAIFSESDTSQPVDQQPANQTKLSITRLVLVVIWCLALYGLLNVYRLDLGYFSGLCGRWGCLAPTASLLGLHLVWLSVLSTAAIASLRWKPALRKWLTRGFLGCGLLMTFCICGAAVIQWHPSVNECVQLFPFQIVRLTDFPAAQCLLLGTGLMITSRRRKTLPAATTV